jgi:hypothetical protein
LRHRGTVALNAVEELAVDDRVVRCEVLQHAKVLSDAWRNSARVGMRDEPAGGTFCGGSARPRHPVLREASGAA